MVYTIQYTCVLKPFVKYQKHKKKLTNYGVNIKS